jgi:GAF domain-containing protein
VDDTTVRTVVGSGHLGERSAMELRRDPDRLDDARRLRPGRAGTLALDRLAELASRLLGTPAGQVWLLTDVQLVAAGTGALVVADAWADERVRDLPPVASRQIGVYLGVPLTGHAGTAIGALCVFGPEPRAWSETDITTLRQLAEPVQGPA